MNNPTKKTGTKIQIEIPKDDPASKRKFISMIVKSHNLSEESRINLLGGLVATHDEGVALKIFNDDRKFTLSTSGGDGKARSFEVMDEFARHEYFACRDSHPRWSNAQFAQHLIAVHGAKKVGSLDPLRKKIGRWKKKLNNWVDAE